MVFVLVMLCRAKSLYSTEFAINIVWDNSMSLSVSEQHDKHVNMHVEGIGVYFGRNCVTKNNESEEWKAQTAQLQNYIIAYKFS